MWPSVFGSLHDYSFWQLVHDRWQALVVYYALLAIVLALLARPLYRVATNGERRSRVGVALLLTALLTPGTISDFFLVAIPGPAIIGLGLAALTLASAGAMVQPSKLPSMVLAVFGDYGLALIVVFGVCYGCLVLIYHAATRGVDA